MRPALALPLCTAALAVAAAAGAQETKIDVGISGWTSNKRPCRCRWRPEMAIAGIRQLRIALKKTKLGSFCKLSPPSALTCLCTLLQSLDGSICLHA